MSIGDGGRPQARRLTGDTLCDADHPILLERMEFPDAGDPASPSSRRPWAIMDKLGVSLNRLAARKTCPSACAPMSETGQTIIGGMGEPPPGDHR